MPQWWAQLAAWRRSRYRQFIESDPFGGLIGRVCGTFAPNALVQVITVAAVLYGSPASGAIVFGVYGAYRAGILWLIVSWRSTSADIDHAFELTTGMAPRLRLIPNPPKDTDGRREESGRGG